MRLTASIVTKSSDSVIIPDSELYLYNKTDQSEGRLLEARTYEQSAINRFKEEAQVYIGNFDGVINLHDFKDIIIDVTPVREVTSIQYYDEENEIQTLDTSKYYVQINDGICRIMMLSDQTFPEKATRPDAVKINFTCGYTSQTIPALIKHAIIMHVTYWFNNPEEVGRSYPTSFDRVINQYRNNWV